jgi:hypothetical protein
VIPEFLVAFEYAWGSVQEVVSCLRRETCKWEHQNYSLFLLFIMTTQRKNKNHKNKPFPFKKPFLSQMSFFFD